MSTADANAPASMGPLELQALRNARNASLTTREDLDSRLSSEVGKYTSEDTSLVVFGSLARGEWTSKSDLDWTYLIDGEANSDHLKISQRIQKLFLDWEYGEPGPTGTFGNMAFSHDIIHQIGGQYDTNKNTTQRILLLLESCPIGRRTEAYERVIRGVINRYLEEDVHPLLTTPRDTVCRAFFSMTSFDFGGRWPWILPASRETAQVRAGDCGTRNFECHEN